MPLLRHYKNQMVIKNNSADKKKEFAHNWPANSRNRHSPGNRIQRQRCLL